MDAPTKDFVEKLGDELANLAEMTPREEAIPLLAQVVYDQAHKNTSVDVTVHGVDWNAYQALGAEEQFARGTDGKVTAWKKVRLVAGYPALDVTYFPAREDEA